MNAMLPGEDGGLDPVRVERWRDGVAVGDDDEVAAEVPVAFEYNGIAQAVMLASPLDLEDFAAGFSLTEGIVASVGEIYDIEIERRPDGIVVGLAIAGARFAALKERRRSLAGRTGCGLCGAESLPQVLRSVPPVTAAFALGAAALHDAFAEIGIHQRLQRRSGATHAAAWVDAGGDIVALREDIGRHNALDKLVGSLARQGRRAADGALLLTSRASYEMVLKAATAGIGLVAAISAPTSLAIRQAAALGLTLVGFVRDGRHVVYTHSGRLVACPTDCGTK